MSNETVDQMAAAVQKTPNRVTLDSIKQKIRTTEYLNPTSASHVTICVITMENGFIATGVSSPADPANFDFGLAQRISYDKALNDIWLAEGYLLKQKMYEAR